MSKMRAMSMAAALIAVGTILYTSPASATPVSNAFAIKNAVPNNFEAVQWRGGGWRGGGWRGGGWGWRGGGWRGRRWGYYGGGFAAGAIIGGALAAPYYYGYGPYPGPYYSAPAYYGAPADGDAVSYCMQRFRSYNPRTGTYLGNDGLRHPCP